MENKPSNTELDMILGQHVNATDEEKKEIHDQINKLRTKPQADKKKTGKKNKPTQPIFSPLVNDLFKTIDLDCNTGLTHSEDGGFGIFKQLEKDYDIIEIKISMRKK